jgi:hypothetical protein
LTRGTLAGVPGCLGAPGEVPPERVDLRSRPRWRHDAEDDRDPKSGLSRRGCACGPYDQREGGRGGSSAIKIAERVGRCRWRADHPHGGLTIHMGKFSSAPGHYAGHSVVAVRECVSAVASRGPHEEAPARELLYIHKAGNCCTLAVGPVPRKRVGHESRPHWRYDAANDRDPVSRFSRRCVCVCDLPCPRPVYPGGSADRMFTKASFHVHRVKPAEHSAVASAQVHERDCVGRIARAGGSTYELLHIHEMALHLKYLALLRIAACPLELIEQPTYCSNPNLGGSQQ